MAKLQVFSQVATPVPFRLALASCCARVGPPCSSSRKHLAAGATSNGLRMASSLRTVAGGWAKCTGSRRALTERGTPRASVLETEIPVDVESRPTESLQSSMQASFETEAVEGRVECSNGICRPIYEEETGANVLADDDWNEGAFRSLEARASLYASKRSTRDLEIRPCSSFSSDFAEFLNDVWKQTTTASKYYEIAMKKNPNNADILLQYAQFAWKTLGDLEKADYLFCRAIKLEESVFDSDAHATYALFLWQTDV